MKVSRKGSSNKVKVDYTLKDAYNYYKENSSNPVSYTKFREFLLGKDSKSGLIKNIKEDILLQGFPLHLSARTGDLRILKNEPKLKFINGKPFGKPVDWKATKALWENNPEERIKKNVIFFDNKETKGFVSKVRWDVFTATFKAKSVYKFKMVREFNRSLVPLLKANIIDFRTIG